MRRDGAEAENGGTRCTRWFVGCLSMDGPRHERESPRLAPHFSFLCLLPHRPLAYSSWSGAPNYTSRVTDENERPAVRRRPVPWKGVPVHSCFFPRSLPLSLSLSAIESPLFSLSLSLFLSVCVFFTLVATKGPLSVARHARLFYTPNVIQPRSYLKLFLSLSLAFGFFTRGRVYTSLYPRALFLFRSKVFLKPWRHAQSVNARDEEGRRGAVGRGRRAVVGTTKKNCISPLIPSPVERLGRERIKKQRQRVMRLFTHKGRARRAFLRGTGRRRTAVTQDNPCSQSFLPFPLTNHLHSFLNVLVKIASSLDRGGKIENARILSLPFKIPALLRRLLNIVRVKWKIFEQCSFH